MSNKFFEDGSLGQSMVSGAKTGTGIFMILTALDMIQQIWRALLHAICSPIWKEWDRRMGNVQAPPIQNPTNHQENWNSLTPEEQLRIKMDIQREIMNERKQLM